MEKYVLFVLLLFDIVTMLILIKYPLYDVNLGCTYFHFPTWDLYDYFPFLGFLCKYFDDVLNIIKHIIVGISSFIINETADVFYQLNLIIYVWYFVFFTYNFDYSYHWNLGEYNYFLLSFFLTIMWLDRLYISVRLSSIKVILYVLYMRRLLHYVSSRIVVRL